MAIPSSSKGYQGPVGLAGSRFAPAPVPTIQVTDHAAPVSEMQSSSTIAVAAEKQSVAAGKQPVAAGKQPVAAGKQSVAAGKQPVGGARDANTQPAVAQALSPDEAIVKKIKTEVANVHILLTQVRKILGREKPIGALAQQRNALLWAELEKLYQDVIDRANDAVLSMPEYMGKNKVNISPGMKRLFFEAADELNPRQKTDQEKLQDLQKQISRLTLEKGLLWTELHEHEQKVKEAALAKQVDTKAYLALKQEIESLETVKDNLLSDKKVLTEKHADMEAKFFSLEQRTKKYYEPELCRMREEIDQKDREIAKHASFLQWDKEGDMPVMTEKFKTQCTEYTALLKAHYDLKQQAESLKATITQQQEQLTAVEAGQRALEDLKRNHSDLIQQETTTEKASGRLNQEFKEVLDKNVAMASELATVVAKAEKLEKEISKLQLENSELLEKQADYNMQGAVVSTLKAENANLNNTVQELRQQETRVAGYTPDNDYLFNEKGGIEEKLQKAGREIDELQARIVEADQMAHQAYVQLKSILPTFRQADAHRRACEEKDSEIQALKEKLDEVQSTGATSKKDAMYWMEKYNDLLDSF